MNGITRKNTWCHQRSESLPPPSQNVFVSYESVPLSCHIKFLPPYPKSFFHICTISPPYQIYGTKYSRVDQVKFVEDSL